MKPTFAFFGAATLLSVLASAHGAAAPDKTPNNSVMKIQYLLAGTGEQGKAYSSPVTSCTIWETRNGERVELSGSGSSNVLLLPNEMNVGYLLDAKTKQAQVFVKADYRFNIPTASDTKHLHNVKLCTPINFQGYPCTVVEAKQTFAGEPGHVQIWAARVDGNPLLLRSYWQGEDGSTFLYEAVNVEQYKQAPADLLHIPAGYTIMPLKTAHAAP